MMERRQGRYFENETLLRIKYLLTETDLSMSDIATRMGCSKSAIATINRKFSIRLYCTSRISWNDGKMIPVPKELITPIEAVESQGKTGVHRHQEGDCPRTPAPETGGSEVIDHYQPALLIDEARHDLCQRK